MFLYIWGVSCDVEDVQSSMVMEITFKANGRVDGSVTV